MASVAATAAHSTAVRLVNPTATFSSTGVSRNGKLECSSSSSQGLGWMGVAVLRYGADFLEQRRKCISGARVATNAGDAEEDEYPVGATCPLYSDLKSVAIAPSAGRKARNLRSSRMSKIRSVATPVDGGVVVEPSRTLTTEQVLPRIGKVSRLTKETSVEVELNLDGTGICECDTGIPFLDHMLDQLASHGLLDVKVKATGDVHIDDHHTQRGHRSGHRNS